MPSKDVHNLIPRTWKYLTSHGKKGLADFITLMTLRWEVILDCPGEPKVTTWS